MTAYYLVNINRRKLLGLFFLRFHKFLCHIHNIVYGPIRGYDPDASCKREYPCIESRTKGYTHFGLKRGSGYWISFHIFAKAIYDVFHKLILAFQDDIYFFTIEHLENLPGVDDKRKEKT